MRKLQQIWGRLRRGVRRRWTDWRTGTLEVWGGPFDGARRDAEWGVGVERGRVRYCAYGDYVLRDGRWMWEQYARNEVTRPPDYPYPDTESWS